MTNEQSKGTRTNIRDREGNEILIGDRVIVIEHDEPENQGRRMFVLRAHAGGPRQIGPELLIRDSESDDDDWTWSAWVSAKSVLRTESI